MLLRTLVVAVSLAFAAPRAEAAPEWRPAPESAIRPTVAAPEEGWSSAHGLYAEVHGDWSDRATVTRLANRAAESVPALAKRMGVRPGGSSSSTDTARSPYTVRVRDRGMGVAVMTSR